MEKERDEYWGGRHPSDLMQDITKLIYAKLKSEPDGGAWHYFEVKLTLVPSRVGPAKEVITERSAGEF